MSSGQISVHELTWAQTPTEPFVAADPKPIPFVPTAAIATPTAPTATANDSKAAPPATYEHKRTAPPAWPFDGIVASDVTYHERNLIPLLQTIYALSSEKTLIIIGGEIRCEITHARFIKLASESFGFTVTPLSQKKMKIPADAMDSDVFVLVLKRHKTAKPTTTTTTAAAAANTSGPAVSDA